MSVMTRIGEPLLVGPGFRFVRRPQPQSSNPVRLERIKPEPRFDARYPIRRPHTQEESAAKRALAVLWGVDDPGTGPSR